MLIIGYRTISLFRNISCTYIYTLFVNIFTVLYFLAIANIDANKVIDRIFTSIGKTRTIPDSDLSDELKKMNIGKFCFCFTYQSCIK